MNFDDFQRCRETLLRERADVLDCAATNLYAALARLIPPFNYGPQQMVHRCHIAAKWAEHYGFPPETSRRALVSCGVRDSLALLFRHFAGRNARLWLPADNYPIYGELARVEGLSPHEFATLPEPAWPEEGPVAESEVLIVTNPLKPLGRWLTDSDVAALTAWLPRVKALDCFDLYEDAEFYDTEFATRELEIPFYRKHAKLAGGPVLEVACGTGRITLPVARDGVDVTGLDVSRPMIEQARRKSIAERLNVTWVEQDCRAMRFDGDFALIFSATNAMQHLLDVESVCAFLQSARRALAPDGKLILDVFNPDPGKLARTSEVRYLHKTITLPGGEHIRVETASQYHADTQILHFELFYLGDERLLRTKLVNMRCFFPEELLTLCRFNGLEVEKRFGDYDEAEFSGISPKQILICRPTDHLTGRLA